MEEVPGEDRKMTTRSFQSYRGMYRSKSGGEYFRVGVYLGSRDVPVSQEKCETCCYPDSAHGTLDGKTVCPGDLLVVPVGMSTLRASNPWTFFLYHTEIVCRRCLDGGWVCENHPNRSFGIGERADCKCGAAGMLCTHG